MSCKIRGIIEPLFNLNQKLVSYILIGISVFSVMCLININKANA